MLGFAFVAIAAGAQTNGGSDWTWMGGSNTVPLGLGRAGVYGTLGTPAAGNFPGSRIEASNWTDSSGNLWLFGGQGYDINGVNSILNDLWQFNPSANEWTWIGGSNTGVIREYMAHWNSRLQETPQEAVLAQ